ncbi:XRE family transcriptional regulator [Sphingopyxis sp. HIX]|nr:XRE family transcriptional regulator [Sphingopyxis sp. HIX]KTE84206.1 XRE family transcriptional regulator [Sphingopyxis sp. HXXIV]
MHNRLDILLVEDNADLAANIIDYLEAIGHRLHYAADGDAGLRDVFTRPIDLVLLDVALPRRDGLSVCAEVRRRADRRIPILMLTARDTLGDKLAGFASGADDYLVKPFALAELAARIGALAHRTTLQEPYRLVIGPLAVDRQARLATRDGRLLHLSPRLWDLLLLLAEMSPNPVARIDATRRLWGDEPPSSDVLRAHIHLLRQIVDKPFAAPMIETVHGVGFRLVVPA